MKTPKFIELQTLINLKENQLRGIAEDLKALKRSLKLLSQNNDPASSVFTENPEAKQNPYPVGSIPFFAFSILKDVGRPLSNTEIFEEFQKRTNKYGRESVVNNLHREATKNNRFIVKNKHGFGLKEWDR